MFLGYSSASNTEPHGVHWSATGIADDVKLPSVNENPFLFRGSPAFCASVLCKIRDLGSNALHGMLPVFLGSQLLL